MSRVVRVTAQVTALLVLAVVALVALAVIVLLARHWTYLTGGTL